MQKNNYSFSTFEFSSKIIRDLVENSENVSNFIDDFFSIKTIKKQIDKKQFTNENRNVLKKALLDQNKNTEISTLTINNIHLLGNSNTFTITTGHQLNALTGPLYSIYKIIQIIVWTEKLQKEYPKFNFIPTFWLASEDHDFEEINHINLFNTKIELANIGQQNFITGKIEPTNVNDFMSRVLNKFADIELKNQIEKYLNYYKNSNLTDATRNLLNNLFGKYGLVIIDGNDNGLKQLFSPIVTDELKYGVTSKSVSITNNELNTAGYHNQVFLRPCNLFYIKDKTTRYRIIKTDSGFEINNNQFTVDDLIKEAKNYPERFSPNALLRPLYQETILPNLAYFGGGGEIAYWLQLKELFKNTKLTFPLLRVRDSYVLLNQKDINLLNELNYSVLNLKQNIDDLIKNYVKNNSTNDISMVDEIEVFNSLKTKLTTKVESRDIGIKRFIEGELVKIEGQLDKIEKKLIQNEKKSQEKIIKQIERLKNKIYPKNGFQERYENFIQYINKPDFIADIKKEAEQDLTDQPQIKIITI